MNIIFKLFSTLPKMYFVKNVDSQEMLEADNSTRMVLYQKETRNKKLKCLYSDSCLVILYNFGRLGDLRKDEKIARFKGALGRELSRVDVFVLCECEEIQPNDLVDLAEYHQIFTGRSEHRGGLLMLVRKTLLASSHVHVMPTKSAK